MDDSTKEAFRCVEYLRDFCKRQPKQVIGSMITCPDCPFQVGEGTDSRCSILCSLWSSIEGSDSDDTMVGCVPFDLDEEEDRDALRGRWIAEKDKKRLGSMEQEINAFLLDEHGWRILGWGDLDGKALLDEYVFMDEPHKGEPVGKYPTWDCPPI